ncbi:hypothetical protein [Vibrio parahaemolyticus]|uniref:hypothetical protein n=1 Tax=Vibrio parahaemolyticus TaxID=670 RepID=UPI001D16A936|nr:hypothetical protein [Vibrio parahaemolyticus]EJC1211840.1 hypothetical protein [Vibrio parahaemolyticus]MCC3817998.1 hypothetical protein [Vibrio parahaemolyticus]MCC3854660.1 hypothetical protein [Vibrio parahaemolyticus]
MDIQSVTTTALAILGSIGGGGAIIMAFSSYFGKLWANKMMEKDKNQYARDLEKLKSEMMADLEQHKVALKKSEIIFQKTLDSANEFSFIFHKLIPERTCLSMDYSDVCNFIALKFEDIEKDLSVFLNLNSVILPTEVRKLLEHSQNIASEGKLIVTPPDDLNAESYQLADELYTKLKNANELLIKEIKDASLSA